MSQMIARRVACKLAISRTTILELVSKPGPKGTNQGDVFYSQSFNFNTFLHRLTIIPTCALRNQPCSNVLLSTHTIPIQLTYQDNPQPLHQLHPYTPSTQHPVGSPGSIPKHKCYIPKSSPIFLDNQASLQRGTHPRNYNADYCNHA